MMEKNQKIIEFFFKEYFFYFSKNTVDAYRISLKQFFTYTKKNFDVVSRQDVREWIFQLVEKGISAKSIHLKMSALRTFYQFCIEENLVSVNPIARLKLPKIPEPVTSYLEKSQLIKLKEAAQSSLRNRAFIEVLYATGARVSEALNIKIDDVDFDSGTIWIKKGKGNLERFVLFNSSCAVRLKKYLTTRKIDSPYLFPNEKGVPLSRAWAAKIFREYSNLINIKITPHSLRHALGSHLAEKEMNPEDIQEILGHKNINNISIYTKLNDQARKKIYDHYNN